MSYEKVNVGWISKIEKSRLRKRGAKERRMWGKEEEDESGVVCASKLERRYMVPNRQGKETSIFTSGCYRGGGCDRPLRQAQEEEDFWLVQADSYGHLTKCSVGEILPIDCIHPTSGCPLFVSVPFLFVLFPF